MRHTSIINPEWEKAVDEMVRSREAADEKRKRKLCIATSDETMLDIDVEEENA